MSAYESFDCTSKFNAGYGLPIHPRLLWEFLHDKIDNLHFQTKAWWSILFPDLTCLLVSTKTQSSGIINKLISRARMSFAFKIWYFQSQLATFLVFFSAYRMPLWNVSTSTLSLEAMQTKAHMRHENGTPNILDSAVDYSRTLYLHNGADQKACGLQNKIAWWWAMTLSHIPYQCLSPFGCITGYQRI